MKPIVLLVDDDENILRGLTRSLRNQPYELFTANSGQEALLILKTHNVDVIVSDEMMPGMLGGELLAWVAQNLPETIRIIMTGKANTAIAVNAINQGQVYYFFTKPCDEVQLAVTIRKAIEHRLLLAENRRLSSVSRKQFNELHHIYTKMQLLAKVIAKDLGEPLDKVTHACSTLTNNYSEYFEPKSKELLEHALDGVHEIQSIADELLAHADSNITEGFSSQNDESVSESNEIPQYIVPVS
jgi:two-component system, probable response regulator PhcQ